MMPTTEEAGLGHNNPPEPTIAEQMKEATTELRKAANDLREKAKAAPKVCKTEEDLHALGEVVKDARKVAKMAKTQKDVAKAPFLDITREIDAYFNVISERVEGFKKAAEDLATDYQRRVADEARRVREEEARKAREKADAERRKAEEAAEAGRRATAGKAADRAAQAEDEADRHEKAATGSAADLTRTRGESGVLATAKTSWKGEIEDIQKVDLEALRPYLSRDAIEKALNQFVRVNKGSRTVDGCRIFADTRAAFR